MNMEVPTSQVELNEEQQKVAHPLRLKTAMEVAGLQGQARRRRSLNLYEPFCTALILTSFSYPKGMGQSTRLQKSFSRTH
jgi:hypothetical protein